MYIIVINNFCMFCIKFSKTFSWNEKFPFEENYALP